MGNCRIDNWIQEPVLIAVFIILLTTKSFSQSAYFIDGYHGGIYGHYPDLYTQFLVDMFNNNPDWKISLEIEPETWDSIKVEDNEAYQAFKELLISPQSRDRIEFTNPSYGQGYLYYLCSGGTMFYKLFAASTEIAGI